jgi:DnaB-like helicase N terminal domain/AAA domain
MQTNTLPPDGMKPLPASLEAERAILAAILLDNTVLSAAMEKIHPQDLFFSHHQHIYAAMTATAKEGRPLDLITLANTLRDTGKIDAAGGAAYISQLVDGVPRISNVSHYCQIVHEKAELRRIIHKCHAVENSAMEGLAKPGDALDDLEIFLRASRNGNGYVKRAVATDFQDFLLRDFAPRTYICDPVLPEQGLMEIHAWRGLGKTFIAWDWAYCIATGLHNFGPWTIPSARKSLLVDGEMAANELQDRLYRFAKGHNMEVPGRNSLRIITPDEQPGNQSPNIATAEGQRRIEEYLEEGMVLWLDSLSTLLRTPKEDDEAWFLVQEWLLRLRTRRITTAFLHHSGKGGTQRGTSKREDFLNAVAVLRRPADYRPEEGLRIELHWEKTRGTKGAAVLPHEIRLDEGSDGSYMLAWRPLQNVLEHRAAEMFQLGMKDRDIWEELHLSRFQVYRLRKKWQGGDLHP